MVIAVDVVNTKRLERIEKLKKLFVWPVGLWIVLMVITLVLDFTPTASNPWLENARSWFESAAFYSLPIILFYIVFATFYGSYKILESRGHKNLAVFGLVQLAAYFIVRVLEFKIPSFDKGVSLGFTVLVAAVLFTMMAVVQAFIRLPSKVSRSSTEVPKQEEVEGGKDKSPRLRLPGPALGILMSGLISIVIASIVHFRVREGVSFVTWGVLFGSLMSIIAFKADRNLLGLLFFLDPGGAENLFKLLSVKREVEDQKDLGEVERELTLLGKQKMKTAMEALANELDQHFTQAQFDDTRERVQSLIDKLKGSRGLPQAEQAVILQDVTMAIDQLREKQSLPALPAPDYSSLSLGEKMEQFVGLSGNEIQEAEAEGLISGSQSHLWSIGLQTKVKLALDDFDKEDLRGNGPIFLANSWLPMVEANKHILQPLTDRLVSATPEEFIPLKGAERAGLFEVHFGTVTKEYSAIVKRGSNSAIVVVGIGERPEHGRQRASPDL